MVKKPQFAFEDISPKMSVPPFNPHSYENANNTSNMFDKIVETSQDLLSSTTRRLEEQTNTNQLQTPMAEEPGSI